MINLSIRISNIDAIRAAFVRAPAKMTTQLNQAIRKSIFLVEREAKQHTPVRTGRLRASYVETFQSLQGTLEPTAFYALFVHDGTRYMQGRPFLLNAIETEQPEVDKLFTEAVQTVLDDIGDAS